MPESSIQQSNKPQNGGVPLFKTIGRVKTPGRSRSRRAKPHHNSPHDNNIHKIMSLFQ